MRLRLDRSQKPASKSVATMPPQAIESAAPTVVVLDDPAFLVAVVPDAPAGRLSVHDRQLFGAARILAGRAGAVIALVDAGCEDLGGVGADRIGALPDDPAAYAPDCRAARLAEAFAALSPRHILFGETANGGDLARRVAMLTGEALFTDVELVSATVLSRAAHGRRVEQRRAPTRLISLAVDAAAAYAGAPREARPHALTTSLPLAGTSAILEARDVAADPARVPLALADFVASAGNGITDFETFRSLVAALGATPGASRVLCDAGLMPRDAQVGASGTVLAATCYLALGIAGAPQHLQGVAGCEHVVAVNTDLHAAMVERAGLAIVQDAQRVMPALLAELAREAGDMR